MSEVSACQVTNPAHFEHEYEAPTGLTKLMIYIMSLILPIGLITGVYYSTKPGQECRVFGKNCLIFSVTPILLAVVSALIAFLSLAIFFGIKY